MAKEGASGPADDLGGTILKATIVELVKCRPAGLSHEGVATRAGVSVHQIAQRWPSSRELLSAALDSYFGEQLPTPDTGSLRSDLETFAVWLADLYNTPTGRRALDAFIARPSDWEFRDTRQAMLDVRDRRFGEMFRRAAARGECSGDVDVGRFLDLLAMGVAVPLIFYGRPVTQQDAVFVVNTVLCGVAAGR
jgi:AcrR family transcriptional regulator